MSLPVVAGIAVLCAVCVLILREARAGVYAEILTVTAGVLFLVFLLDRVKEYLSAFSPFFGGQTGELACLLLQVLGVAYLTEFASGICRDLGNASLGAKLELCGRIEIFILCLPQIMTMLNLAVTTLH